MSNRIGPKLTIIYSCEGCSFYEFQGYSPPLSSTHICSKLGKRLYSPIPHEKCPFKIINTLQFCEETNQNIKEQEELRIHNIISIIFHDIFNFELENNQIVFDIHGIITADQIKKLYLEFPNLDYNIIVKDKEFLRLRANI